MYWIKIVEEQPTGFPMNDQTIRELHRNTSFPAQLNIDEMREMGYAPYQMTYPPVITKYQTCVEGTPSFDGVYAIQTWTVSSVGIQEKEAIDRQILAEAKAQQRRLLQDSDWTEMPSVQSKRTQEWKDAWAAYRTALRDADKQETWPETVEWPKEPTVSN